MTARPGRRRLHDAGLGVLGTALLVAMWWVIWAAGWVSPKSLPPPHDVARRIGTLLGDSAFWLQMRDTMWTWALSLVIVTAIMVPVGLVIGQVAAIAKPTQVAVNGLRSVPATALLPLAILTFQLGWEMKLALTLYAIAWPVLINTMYGSQRTEPLRLDVARTLRWSRVRTFRSVVFPSALPMIATGIRIAAGTSLVVVLSAELLGASHGVGVMIRIYQQAERPDFVYAGIVLVGLLGMALFSVLVAVENHLVRWSRG